MLNEAIFIPEGQDPWPKEVIIEFHSKMAQGAIGIQNELKIIAWNKVSIDHVS